MLKRGSDIYLAEVDTYPKEVDMGTSDSEIGEPSAPAASSQDARHVQSEPVQLENSQRNDRQEDLPKSSDAQERTVASLRDGAPHQHEACEVVLRCVACDRIGCNPEDPQQVPLCPYFGKTRGEVPWTASESALRDTALGDNVRHFAEANVRRVAPCAFLINGEQYLLGTCPGEGNNCLIHALQQCCSAASWPCRKDVADVRLALQSAFPDGGQHEVQEANPLTLDVHWRELLQSMLGISTDDVDATFAIWCLDIRLGSQSADSGDAVGTGQTVLRLARTGHNHFVPFVHRPAVDFASLIQDGTNKPSTHTQSASAPVRGRDHSYWDYESATDVPLVVEGASPYVRIFARGWLPRGMYEKVYASSMKIAVLTSLHEDMKRFKENVLLLHDEWNPNLHDCLRQIRQARLQTGADDFAILNEAQVNECLWMWAQQYVFHEGDLLKPAKKQRVLLKKAIKKEVGCQYRVRAIIKRGLADMVSDNEQELAGNFFNLIGEIEREAASMKRERTQRRHRRASSKAASGDALERAPPDAVPNGAANQKQKNSRAETGSARASRKAKKGQKWTSSPKHVRKQTGTRRSWKAIINGMLRMNFKQSKRKVSDENAAPEEDYYD